jgi:hypothetical protein
MAAPSKTSHQPSRTAAQIAGSSTWEGICDSESATPVIYEIELTPVRKYPGFYQVDLVNGAVRENLIKRCAYCMREAAAILLARGASPDDELIARHAGAMKVGMRAPLGSLKPAPKKAAAEVAE